jgi:hypothetical protein
MRLALRTQVRVIPVLLHGRDEHLGRDTEFPATRGIRDWAAARRRDGRREPATCALPARRRAVSVRLQMLVAGRKQDTVLGDGFATGFWAEGKPFCGKAGLCNGQNDRTAAQPFVLKAD